MEQVFLCAGCPSCHPTISVKALKGTQSTNTNQCPGPILSSSTTRVLTKGVLLPLCRLSDVSTCKVVQCNYTKLAAGNYTGNTTDIIQ